MASFFKSNNTTTGQAPVAMALLGLVWLFYFVVFVLIFYKSYRFFQSLKTKPEFRDMTTVKDLETLYLTAFIVQISVIGLFFLTALFLRKK